MRKCPRCHQEMKEDCYVKDGAQPVYDYQIVKKDSDFKKSSYPLKAALCETCGYVELYVEYDKE